MNLKGWTVDNVVYCRTVCSQVADFIQRDPHSSQLLQRLNLSWILHLHVSGKSEKLKVALAIR